MAGITTHVLNISTGRPIAGMQIDLYDLKTTPPTLLKSVRSNPDGRTDGPMLTPEQTRVGDFELRFYVGAHFKNENVFSEEIPVRFTVFDAKQHYHVPLLCSPWCFSTYRGS
ncbi:hydroxyisourate hydrolase [Noviherbaspirillum denitrificans]|uniref:5-hydroxyisourate hydrolase n=1 Tax=Noviherbaspirillum denitrificans TaxID=1968433 RepID=A0A254TF26_9BURK|nr:hydroxyisourate hydrolase [Noviherbaspirillum denitrificans]OWW21259.1 5-hydroxyisourate hydrolase [Noviherbaspirillum denitrificans]